MAYPRDHSRLGTATAGRAKRVSVGLCACAHLHRARDEFPGFGEVGGPGPSLNQR